MPLPKNKFLKSENKKTVMFTQGDTQQSDKQLINLWPSNSRSNWNLEMLVFEERGKPENPEKNPWSKGENQHQTQPTYDAGSGNRTWDTLVGGERSHHCSPLQLSLTNTCIPQEGLKFKFPTPPRPGPNSPPPGRPFVSNSVLPGHRQQ